jgi:hypothetical protein
MLWDGQQLNKAGKGKEPYLPYETLKISNSYTPNYKNKDKLKSNENENTLTNNENNNFIDSTDKENIFQNNAQIKKSHFKRN